MWRQNSPCFNRLYSNCSGGAGGLIAGVEGVSDLEELIARIQALSEQYFALHRADPGYRGIWAAVQTDPALQALDVADSLRNAEAVFRIALPLYRKVDPDRLMTTCALSMQMALYAARFALAIPEPLSTLSADVFSNMARCAFQILEEG